MKKIYIWSILTLIIATFLPGGLCAQEQTSANSTGAVAQRETGTHVTADEARAVGLRFLNANTSRTRGAGDLQMATAYRTAQGDTAFYVFNAANGFVMVAADRCATPILGYSDEGPFNTNNVPVQMQGYLQGFVEQIAYGIGHPTAADATKAQQWEQVRSTGHLTNSRANMAMGNNPANAVMANNRMTKSVMMARDSSGKMVRKEVSLNDLMNSNAEDNHIVMPTLPQSNRESRSGGNGVAPLITAMWDQDCYYNAACPVDTDGICGHVPTGCVATAMGMIMHYWGYPAQGTGAHSYTPDGYPTQTVNFGTTTYDWANMPDQLTSTSSQAEIDAVSTLLWHCGVAADMLYGATSSSALDGSIPQAFSSYFGYCNGAYFLSKGDDAEWLAQVKASLDRNRPLLYFGTDVTGLGGHAFVCDGYDASDNLHFNWGWGGNGNGYFAVDALNVDVFQFNNDIHALFGIVPQSEFQLHYNIIEGGAEVTYEVSPDLVMPAYNNYPDTIVIPAQVTIDNVTYPVVAIGNYAFNSCTDLKYVDMPNTISSIGDFSFANDIYITEIDLPDSLKVIGECALMALSISTLDLPPTLTTIGRQAFSFMNYAEFSCYNINNEYFTTLTIPRSVTSCGNGITLGSLVDTLNWNADSCVLVHDGGVWAFGVSSLNLGEHVRYLPEYIFSNNYCLSVTLPESLEYAGDYCFSNFGNLTTITIPKNVKYFGNGVFSGCSSLVTVNFNAKRCEYAPYLFDGCGFLKTINFGDSVRVVPGNLCVDILHTPSITTVNFGSSIDTIDYYAFMGCSNITSITLPSSIKHIERGAFGNCAQLITVDMTTVTNPPSLGVWGPFDGNAEDRKFLISCESYDAYWNAGGWYYHDGGGNTVFDYDYRIDLKSVPETEIQSTAVSNDTIQGRVVLYKNASVCDSTTIYFAKANHGYHFDHWNNGSTNNPDTLHLTSDTSVIAYFAKDQFHVEGTSAASVLFSDFEQPEDDTLWTLKNEEYVNRWYINNLDNTRALFISNDNGISNSYVNENAHSYVFAYHPLQLVAGDYFCSFDWRAEGHGFDGQFSLNFGSGDCLFAFLYQGNIDSIPLFYFDGNPEWCYGYDLDNHLVHSLYFTDMFGQHVFNRKSLNLNIITEGEYNLLFYWRNGRTSDMGGEQEPNGYPAAIDNVVFYQLDSVRGYVAGAEIVNYLDTVTLTAVPNYGYHFVGWYDGDTNITKPVIATDNLTVAALFDYNQYQVTVSAADASMGSVSGGGTYNYLSECTITATPAEGLNFIRWSDGNKTNPRIITVTQDTSFTAIFATCANTSTVESVSANESYTWADSLYTTSGIYEHTWTTSEGCDSTVSLWLTITKTQYDTTYVDIHDTTYIDVHDTTYVDVFVPVHDTTYVDVYVPVHDTTYINVHDTTYVNVPYPVHDTTYVDVHDTTYLWQYDTTFVTLHDTTVLTIHDTTYIDVPYPIHDTTYVTLTDTIVLNHYDTTYIDVPYPVHDTTYVTLTDTIVLNHYDTTYISLHDTITITEPLTWYSLQVLSEDMDKGVGAGSGQFPEGTDVEIAAIPIEGNRFLQWSDGSEANPRTITLNDNITLTAMFTPVGVTDLELPSWYVYPEQGAFVVKGTGGHQVSVYDAVGKLLHRYSDAPEILRYSVPAAGSYYIQVDNGAAKKVTVVR